MKRKAIKLGKNYTMSIISTIVERKAIYVNKEEVDWNKLYAEIEGLVVYAAKNIYYNNVVFCQTHCIDVEDFIQEGMLTIYDCWEKYKYKSYNDVLSMCKASIWRRLRDIVLKRHIPTVNIDELVEIGAEPPDSILDLEGTLDTKIKLDKVREILKDNFVALTILSEYLSPSSITIEEMQKDMETKQDLVEQGLLPVTLTPKSLKLTKVIMERSITKQLSITKVSFRENYKILGNTIKNIFKEQ